MFDVAPRTGLDGRALLQDGVQGLCDFGRIPFGVAFDARLDEVHVRQIVAVQGFHVIGEEGFGVGVCCTEVLSEGANANAHAVGTDLLQKVVVFRVVDRIMSVF